MDELRTALISHGDARLSARAAAAAEGREIAALASRALAAGMTKVEVCRLAKLTRPGLDKMLRGT